MKRTADISDFLQPLRDKPYQAYLSNALQVAEQQLGKSEVWQTSFSISEEFIRRLFFIEKSGLVTKFNLVLDHKATNKTLKLWAFITQVINTTYLADNHSKVLLVRSQKGEVVSIITSQNLTRGNRCESAVVTTDLDIFRTLHAQIQDLITNHSVPLNELFAHHRGKPALPPWQSGIESETPPSGDDAGAGRLTAGHRKCPSQPARYGRR